MWGYARRSSRQQTASMYWKYSAGTTMVPASMGRRMCPTTIIITSVGIDQNSGGTFVSGLHSYQGQYIPFRGRKTHTNVQFNAVIVRQPKRDYVVFNKWYEPDMLNRKGGWETGQRLITYK